MEGANDTGSKEVFFVGVVIGEMPSQVEIGIREVEGILEIVVIERHPVVADVDHHCRLNFHQRRDVVQRHTEIGMEDCLAVGKSLPALYGEEFVEEDH